MEPSTQKDNTNQKQLFFKLGFILLLILLLLIPVSLIQGLIEEREGLQRSVEEEIASLWGKEQTIQGPVLCIPYERQVVVDGKNTVEKHQIYLAPEELKISSGIETEIRTKGIFNTVVFESKNQLEGSFDLNILPVSKAVRYQLNEAVLLTGLTDPTAVTQKIEIPWNGNEQQAIPGTPNNDFVKSGFHYHAPVTPGQATCNFNKTCCTTPYEWP